MGQVVIIGAGIGGLTAAIRLARQGRKVLVFEAGGGPGGLASTVELEGYPFDVGPYILLDREGLSWAFQQLGIDLEQQLQLHRVDHGYQVDSNGELLDIFHSLDATADAFERRWTGSGRRYRKFIRRMQIKYARLQPLQCIPRPGVRQLLRTGAWQDIPFLLQSLGSVLSKYEFPSAVVRGLSIWTHVAGQDPANAPAPLAFVPAIMHAAGAYYPLGGIGMISRVLFNAASRLGVEFHFQSRVRAIRCQRGRALGVEIAEREVITADAVLSNVGLGTYLQLLDEEGLRAIPLKLRAKLKRLPLQSPGVCAYLAVRGSMEPPYLKFRIENQENGCRLLVTPGVLDPGLIRNGGWTPARLIAPMSHTRAETGGARGQQAFLNRVLEETWWQRGFQDIRILATRIPRDWGSTSHLFRDSMNPVMTRTFMLTGRLAHRSPWIRGLYLTGSSTHPGQWVSFCAVSGVLTANQLLLDLER